MTYLNELNNYQISDLTEDKIPDVLALMNPLFSVKKSYPFCFWQFCKNTAHISVKIAFLKDKLIGVAGIQKKRLSNGASAGQLSWLMIDQEWRGKGLFQKLTSLAINSMPELDCIFVFANKPAANACQKKIGMRNIRAIHNMNMSVESSKFLQTPAPKYIHIDKNTFKNSSRNKPKAKVNFINPPEYDKWRFAGNPLFEYIKVNVPGLGYTIVKLFSPSNADYHYGDIVDFDIEDYEHSDARPLLDKTIATLKQLGASTINVWDFPGTVIDRALNDAGFLKANTTTCFLIKVLNSKYDNLYDSANWFLKPSDSSNY